MRYTSNDFASSIEQFSNSLCSKFGNLKPVCEHLMVSVKHSRYIKIYMAVLKNDVPSVDHDLHQQQMNTCEQCKNVVQTTKTLWIDDLVKMKLIFSKFITVL